MSDKPSVFDGVDKLYAEMFHNKAVTLTIKSMSPCQIVGEAGRKDKGLEIAFTETSKVYQFNNIVNRRALAEAFGTDDYTKYVGKKVVLVPAQCRGPNGKTLAIRVDAPATTRANAKTD